MDKKTARRIIQSPPIDAEYIARRLVDGIIDWAAQYQSREHAAIDCLAKTAGYRQVYYRFGDFAYLDLHGLEPINNTLLAFGTPPPAFGLLDPRAEVEFAVGIAGGETALEFASAITSQDNSELLHAVYWPAETVSYRADVVHDELKIPALKLLRR